MQADHNFIIHPKKDRSPILAEIIDLASEGRLDDLKNHENGIVLIYFPISRFYHKPLGYR